MSKRTRTALTMGLLSVGTNNAIAFLGDLLGAGGLFAHAVGTAAGIVLGVACYALTGSRRSPY